MTQEEKQLLLKDLSARLPYGVKVLDNSHKNYGVSKLINIGIDGSMLIDNEANDTQYYPIIAETKPYLRPMSSMTKEEEDEWCGLNIDPLLEAVSERHTRVEDSMLRAKSQYQPTEWLIAHHFDYRGLIEKGLAIEVTKENNPYKE